MKTPATLDQITLENLQKIAPEVRDFRVVVGEDHVGDPAVKLTIILDDSVSDDASINRKFRPLDDWIHKVIWVDGGCEFYPFVSYVREFELKEIDAA